MPSITKVYEYFIRIMKYPLKCFKFQGNHWCLVVGLFDVKVGNYT